MHDIDRTQISYPGETESYAMAGESSALSEAEVMELASRLMEVESEEEFEDFLGDIISGVANAVGGLVSPSVGNALGGLIKGAAKKLLPIAGSAIGGYFAGPVGASLGGKLAGSVAGALEVSSEQMEWDAAKDFVRFAADAARNAALAPQGQDHNAIAHQATVEAAQKHAPELIDQGVGPQNAPDYGTPGHHKHGGCGCHLHHHSGHWERRGREIVLFGL
jgi:hypothetical protein